MVLLVICGDCVLTISANILFECVGVFNILDKTSVSKRLKSLNNQLLYMYDSIRIME